MYRSEGMAICPSKMKQMAPFHKTHIHIMSTIYVHGLSPPSFSNCKKFKSSSPCGVDHHPPYRERHDDHPIPI